MLRPVPTSVLGRRYTLVGARVLGVTVIDGAARAEATHALSVGRRRSWTGEARPDRPGARSAPGGAGNP